MLDKDLKDATAIPDKTSLSVVDTTDVVSLEQDSCSPLPEDVSKRSKKRLREVSVEASTAKDDESVVPVEAKEVEVPPKKNRLRSLDPTSPEETKLPRTTTPPFPDDPLLSTSPPHESKVRQIRKRVKDLCWKEARRRRSDGGSPGEVDPQDEGPEVGDTTSEGKVEEEDSSKSVSIKSDSDKEEVERGGEGKLVTIEGTTGPPAGASTGSSDRVVSMDLPKSTAVVEPHVRADVDDKHTETNIAPSSIPRVSPDPDACQGKRRRDDGDQNPREPKRISPPPEQEKTDVKPETVKVTGFMAYASSASPFSAVKDVPNVFGSANPPPKFGTSSIPKPPSSSSIHPAPIPFSSSAPFAPQASAPVTFGSSGFNTYASAASPFGVASTSGSKSPSRVARSKSPGKHANAFGPYTTRSGKFAATVSRLSKKPRRGSNGVDGNDAGTGSGSASGSGDEGGDGDSESPTSFGDILSAKENQPDVTEDEGKKIEFTEQEVMTGEEDERTEYQVRAKLFAMTPPPVSGGWKERGVGTLKLNVHKKSGRARLVLRTDGVLRLVLNTNLFKGMNFEIGQDPRYIKFGLIVDKKVVLHTLRLGSARHAEDLLEQVKAYTPGISVADCAEV